MGLQGFQPYVNGTCVVESPEMDFFNGSDIATIVISLSLLVECLVLSSIALHFKLFPPIAAKQPLLHFVGVIAGFFWIIGNYLINDTEAEVQSWGVYCWIRRFWIAYTFGFGVYISCFIVRFLRLYVVIHLRKKAHNILIYFAILLAPLLVIDIVGFFVESDESCLYVVGTGETQVLRVMCRLHTIWAYFTLVIHIVYMLVAIFFIVALRNIRKSFNEYRELRYQIVLFIAIYITLVVLSLTPAAYTAHGRSAVTILYALIVFLVANTSLLIPVYKTLTKKDEYLAEFKEGLSRDAKEHVNNSVTGSQTKSSKAKQTGGMVVSESKNTLDEVDMLATEK